MRGRPTCQARTVDVVPHDPTPEGGVDPASMRHAYEQTGVDTTDLGPDPLAAFRRWFEEVASAGVAEPNAMVLATSGANGAPAARTVLLKGYAEDGLRFFTNLRSAKATDMAVDPRVALVFPWHAVSRQVRVTGMVSALDRAAVEAYFATRPRDAQLGAWASRQSSVVDSRAALDEALAAVAERFPGEVPAPPFWGGYVVAPQTWEFWAGRAGRLHDRVRYRRTPDGWTVDRLAP
jgi:pyridoxamine 5'-phosphate oxidase